MKLKRNEKTVTLSIENCPGWSADWMAPFVNIEISEFSADMTAKIVDERLRHIFKQIRRAAYNKGWSDAKSKNKKITEFNSSYQDDKINDVGW